MSIHYEEDKVVSINNIKELANKDTVIMGIATTGLNDIDEVIEISIVDMQGNILMNQMIKPTVPISQEASNIHGIFMEDLVNAPSFSDIKEDIIRSVIGRTVCIYYVDFGIRIFEQTSKHYNLSSSPLICAEDLFCMMTNYSVIYGEWVSKWKEYKYCSLINAARCENIIVPNIGEQRALSDAIMMLKIIQTYCNFFELVLAE